MSNPYLEPTEWFATLPTVFASACVLLTDVHDRVLLVKPNYRPGWSIPGGIVEDGESPHDGARREIYEELGLRVEAGALLVLDWAPPLGERPRSMVNFLFDGGTISDGTPLRLQEEELDDLGFFPWEQAAALLPVTTAPRLPAARRARKDQRAVYLPHEAAPWSHIVEGAP
ncbi:NUDIX domain-containing protein [Sphaerimonospora cavernae]|uniref:NUDIX domain-containing protein n=1 Tax=Sphaerimonospora cavernae TaxID=1740611 RepID=A0ABV6TZX8_9ACTN